MDLRSACGHPSRPKPSIGRAAGPWWSSPPCSCPALGPSAPRPAARSGAPTSRSPPHSKTEPGPLLHVSQNRGPPKNDAVFYWFSFKTSDKSGQTNPGRSSCAWGDPFNHSHSIAVTCHMCIEFRKREPPHKWQT